MRPRKQHRRNFSSPAALEQIGQMEVQSNSNNGEMRNQTEDDLFILPGLERIDSLASTERGRLGSSGSINSQKSKSNEPSSYDFSTEYETRRRKPKKVLDGYEMELSNTIGTVINDNEDIENDLPLEGGVVRDQEGVSRGSSDNSGRLRLDSWPSGPLSREISDGIVPIESTNNDDNGLCSLDSQELNLAPLIGSSSNQFVSAEPMGEFTGEMAMISGTFRFSSSSDDRDKMNIGDDSDQLVTSALSSSGMLLGGVRTSIKMNSVEDGDGHGYKGVLPVTSTPNFNRVREVRTLSDEILAVVAGEDSMDSTLINEDYVMKRGSSSTSKRKENSAIQRQRPRNIDTTTNSLPVRDIGTPGSSTTPSSADYTPKGSVNRGRYKCGRCGQLKTNHVCEYSETYFVRAIDTQTEPLMVPGGPHPWDVYKTITVGVYQTADNFLLKKHLSISKIKDSNKSKTVNADASASNSVSSSSTMSNFTTLQGKAVGIGVIPAKEKSVEEMSVCVEVGTGKSTLSNNFLTDVEYERNLSGNVSGSDVGSTSSRNVSTDVASDSSVTGDQSITGDLRLSVNALSLMNGNSNGNSSLLRDKGRANSDLTTSDYGT